MTVSTQSNTCHVRNKKLSENKKKLNKKWKPILLLVRQIGLNLLGELLSDEAD